MARGARLAFATLLASSLLRAGAARADGATPDVDAPKPRPLRLDPTLSIALRGGPVLAGGDPVEQARAKLGAGFGVDVGARVLRHVYGGLTADLMIFQATDTLSRAQDNIVSFGMGPMVGWYMRPEALSAVLELGAGGRMFAVSNQVGRGDSYGSFEGRAMLGLTMPIAGLRVVFPRLDFVGGGAGPLSHAIVTLGASVGYDHALARRSRD